MNWNYTEYKLKGKLSEFINCVWWVNYPETIKKRHHYLVPDNTIELIFTNSNIQRIIPFINRKNEMRNQLCGLKTYQQHCTITQSPSIGIRFNPKKFYLLSQIELMKTINNSLKPKDCFGHSIITLEKQIFEAQSQQDRIKLLESYFQTYLSTEINKSEDPLFEQIMRYMEDTKGTCSINELPNLFDSSIKTIERKFKTNLGLTPKKYCRLIRFVNQFLAHKGSYVNCKEDAFFDQSHFIKEIITFSGLTPQNLFSSNLGIQEVYFGNKKNDDFLQLFEY